MSGGVRRRRTQAEREPTHQGPSSLTTAHGASADHEDRGSTPTAGGSSDLAARPLGLTPDEVSQPTRQCACRVIQAGALVRGLG